MSKVSDEVVAAARAWIGTPYQHQASCRLAGADCLGLLRGVWREIYGREPEKIPAYTRDWNEPTRDEALWRAAERHLVPRSNGQLRRGDVLLFRMRSDAVAKHLGIVAELGDPKSFVHSYTGHGVVESPLTTPWLRRIVANFGFPEKDT